MFGVGSSGFNYAFLRYWQEAGIIESQSKHSTASEVDSLLVISGSASPVIASQIKWARDHGYDTVRIDTTSIIDSDAAKKERMDVIETALNALSTRRGVILYTTLGPEDPMIEKTRRTAEQMGLDSTELGRHIGQFQGKILKNLLLKADPPRTCIVGGDTSSYTIPALDIYALEMIAPISPGAPLCRASARSSQFDGLEIALKGGQIGNERYFELTRFGDSGSCNYSVVILLVFRGMVVTADTRKGEKIDLKR